MQLREALSQIAEIRQQMARGQVFRGYRAATTAFSGAVALAAGLLQSIVFASPKEAPLAFVGTWVGAAVLSIAVVAVEMIIRTRRSQSDVQRQLTLLAVEQFMPSVVAGALLTWVFCDFLSGQIWMLPGLWMILFSLGVFASCRLLPRPVFMLAGFYLVAGILTLIITPAGSNLLLNLYMGGVFGIGQFAIAGILYLKLERTHE